jgi:hypothetical protein
MSWELDVKKAFEQKFSPEPNTGCWLWFGNRLTQRGGYGVFTHRSSKINMQRAHRMSWKLYIDSNITENDHVLHKCDNVLCVNPEHLFIGDQALNMEDMAYKKQHTFGKHHPMYKHGRYVGDKQNPKYHR